MGGPEVRGIRRLTAATAVATFALIVIGGVVRVSDSGLGCGPAGSGTHGWPLCTGRVIPSVGGSTLIEFTHRAVAGLVAVLILVLAWRAWRTMRGRPWIVRGSLAALGLVFAQAVLGGLTVEHNLHAVLVAVHLGVAMVLLAILLAIHRATDPEPEPGRAAEPPQSAVEPVLGAAESPSVVPGAPPAGASAGTGLKSLAALAAVLLLAAIVAGGYVAGTEGEGTAAEPVIGAHLACGQQFPACGDSLLPFGRHSLIDAQLTHRVLMFAATLAILAFVAVALARGIRSRAVLLAGVLVLLQVLLGALNVWLGKHAGLIAGHLTLATLLWMCVVRSGLLLAGVPARATVPLSPQVAERVTA